MNDNSCKSNLDKEENILFQYLNETEEWNDLIIFDSNGSKQFLFSRYNKLDDKLLEEFGEQTLTLISYLIDTSIIPDIKIFKSEKEYFYTNGLYLIGRHWVATRISLPFIFARDLNNNEEICLIKIKDIINEKKYIVVITYFMDYTSALIVNYFKNFLILYDKKLIIDDDYLNINLTK